MIQILHRSIIGLLLLSIAALLAACNTGTASAPAAPTVVENKSTPTTGTKALPKVSDLKTQVDEAVKLYKDGKTDAAYEKAANAYSEGFEYLEEPLKAKDHDLNETIEDQFKDLREDIKAKKPAADVEKLAETLKANLDKAEKLLQ